MQAAPETKHLKWLVAAFAIVALVFLGAAMVSQRAAGRIDTEVADLRSNSLPSVSYLLSGRMHLRQLESLAATDPAATNQAMNGLREALREDVDAYARTGWYPGEKEAFDRELHPALGRLDAAIAALQDGDRSPADYRALSHAADDVDRALAELIDLNNRRALVSTQRILDIRRATVRLFAALEAISSVVAIAAATIAFLAARNFARVSKENAELQAARAGELEAFSARVAHDLLSPLSGTMLTLRAIERQHPDEATKQNVERAARSLSRSRAMVNAVLDFARGGAKPKPDARASLRAALDAAVEEARASDADAPPITVEPFDDVTVACDPSILGVVPSNLLHNAVKFLRGMPVRRIIVRARRSRDSVHVEIEDTGPGLAPGAEETIFEPYVRADKSGKPGLGLGLATVKRVVTSHGGRVGVRRLDSGTVFWFELPLAKEAHEPAAAPHGGAAAAAR